MMSAKSKEGGVVGGTTFWPVLLMAVHGFSGRVIFTLVDVDMYDNLFFP